MGDFISSIASYGVFESIPAAIIAAAVYLGVRLAYLKAKSSSRKSFGTELSRVLLAGYIAALVIIVWFPMLTWNQFLTGDFRFEDLRAVGYYTNNGAVLDFIHGELHGYLLFEFIANIALFIPLGFLLPMSFHRLKWWVVDLIGLGTTCIVELIQPYLGRTGDLDDVITNFTGAVIGCAMAKIILTIRKSIRKSAESP